MPGGLAGIQQYWLRSLAPVIGWAGAVGWPRFPCPLGPRLPTRRGGEPSWSSRMHPAQPGARHDRAGRLDIDDTVRATFGYAKQGAGYGYTGVKD
jgi:hypothetical protein